MWPGHLALLAFLPSCDGEISHMGIGGAHAHTRMPVNCRLQARCAHTLFLALPHNRRVEHSIKRLSGWREEVRREVWGVSVHLAFLSWLENEGL